MLFVSRPGEIYATCGNRSEAENVLAKMKKVSKHQYISSLSFAFIYTTLGEKERAFVWLEKSYAERAVGVDLKTDPIFDPLRSDPRFADLLRRIGFAQ